ncbi:MAG: glycosyltransferase family 10 [Verrucomicrobiales bacterium]
MKRRLKVAYLRQYPDYRQDFVFNLIGSLHPGGIEITSPRTCDLLIIGPFSQRFLKYKPRLKTLLKLSLAGRRNPPRTLHQTGENTRWNAIPADFSISLDLGVSDPNHFRFPLWMSMFDWSREGFQAPEIGRFGPLVEIEQVMRPIGRPGGRLDHAVFFSSYMKEPRVSLLNAVKELMEVDCYGAAFRRTTLPGRRERFTKMEVSRDKTFALCPENSMYPGYYTEKIPDAFACGCIPITWCDSNVRHDFNPRALINMADFADTGYVEGLREAIQPRAIEELRSHPLLLKRPSLDGIKGFLLRVLDGLSS